jgi:hypothetical protein
LSTAISTVWVTAIAASASGGVGCIERGSGKRMDGEDDAPVGERRGGEADGESPQPVTQGRRPSSR